MREREGGERMSARRRKRERGKGRNGMKESVRGRVQG